MAKNRNINVVIKGDYDNSDVQRAIRELQKLQTETGATSGGMSQFGKSIAAVGGAMLAAFSVTKVIDFMQDSAKAAMEDQVSMVALAKAMENVGVAAQNTNVENFVQQLSLANGVADDELRPSLQKLITVTGDVETSQKALALALDISKGAGKSLESVTASLAKGYSGQTTALGRLGVGLDKTLLKSGDMVAITGALSDKFGGQAAAAADTYQGKLDRVNVAAGEAKETIGYALLNALDNVSAAFGGTDGAVGGISSFGQGVADLVTGLGAVAANLATAASAIAKYIQGQEGATQATDEHISSLAGWLQIVPIVGTYASQLANYGARLSGEQMKLAESTRASEEYWASYIATATGAAGANEVVSSSMQDLIDSFKELEGLFSNVQAVDHYKKALLDISDAIDKSSRSLSNNSDAGIKNRDAIIGVFSDAIKAAQAWGDQTGASTEEIQAKFGTMTEKIRDRLIAQGFKASDIDKFLGTIGVWENNAAKIPGALVTGAAGTKAVGVQIGKDLGAGVKQGIAASAAALGLATADLVRYAEQAARDASQTHSPSLLFAAIGKDLVDGLVKGVNDNGKDVRKNLQEAFSSWFSDSLSTLRDKLKEAKDAFKEFAADVSTSVMDALDFKAIAPEVGKDGKVVGGTFLAGLQSQAALAVNFAAQVKELIRMGLSQAALTDVLAAGAAAGSNIANDLIVGGADAITQTNALVAAAQAAADEVGLLAAEKWKQAGVDQAQSNYEGFRDNFGKGGPARKALMQVMDNLAEAAARNVKINVDVVESVTRKVTTVYSSGAPAVHGATGGIVNVPTVALIGEAGPEAVIPLDSTPGNGPISGLGGGGNNYNITVQAGVGDPRQIGQQVVEYIKRFEAVNGPAGFMVA